MKNEGVPIVKEGMPFFLVFLLATIAALVGGWGWLAMPLALVTGYIAYFFRNPERTIPAGENLILSPADGKIVAVEPAHEPLFLKSQAQKISIFLSLTIIFSPLL